MGSPETLSRRAAQLPVRFIVGIAALLFGLFGPLNDSVPEGYRVTVGEVTGIDDCGSDPDGRNLYSAVYTYEVDGTTYTTEGSVCSSSKPKVGSTRAVAYDPTGPGYGYPIGEAGWVKWFITGFGVLFVLGFGAGLATRVAMLAGGVWLWMKSRRRG